MEIDTHSYNVFWNLPRLIEGWNLEFPSLEFALQPFPLSALAFSPKPGETNRLAGASRVALPPGVHHGFGFKRLPLPSGLNHP
ncbi:MAG: hypothetical protein ACK4FS_02585 [Flavobacterium sp.]